MRTRRRRSRQDGQVEEEINRLALVNKWTPAQIRRELKRLQDTQEIRGERIVIPQGCHIPDLRTVERAVKEIVPPDTSDPWSPTDADTYAAELVLPVLAEAIEQSGGGWQRFSKDLARWIVKVRNAAPDMPALWALNTAQAYRAAAEKSDSQEIEGLDQMLAFAPWRGKDHFNRYADTVHMLHPDWFSQFEITANDERTFTMSYKPGSEGFLIAMIGWRPQAQEEDSHD
ncbi:MAG: hypothetical protein ABR978_00665 [Dehalococcoidia bacterium]